MKVNRHKFLEVKPELYDKGEKHGIKGNAYIVHSTDFGLYTKKEATIICDFLRKNAHNLIDMALFE